MKKNRTKIIIKNLIVINGSEISQSGDSNKIVDQDQKKTTITLKQIQELISKMLDEDE